MKAISAPIPSARMAHLQQNNNAQVDLEPTVVDEVWIVACSVGVARIAGKGLGVRVYGSHFVFRVYC